MVLLFCVLTAPVLAAEAGIEAAVQARLDLLPDPDLRWQVLEVVQAGDWAYASAGAYDRASGLPAPTEPLVVLARRAAGGTWQAALPGEPAFDAWLAAAPETLLDAPTKAYLGLGRAPAAPQAEVTGYHVPWLAGSRGTVVRRDGTNHLKQVDFNLWAGSSVAASGTVAAAKAGTVVFAKDSSNSGCPSLDCWRQANLVAIRHGSGEYSWYAHLAYQSVPADIYPGAIVASGDPIGVEGDTGYATGVHLHYMVSSDLPALPDPNDPNAAPWPQNLLTFDFAEAAWEELRAGLVIVSQNSPGPVECPTSGGAILYKHAGYDCGGLGEGQGYAIQRTPGWQNLPASFNDQASSLRLPPGSSARLYQHADRAGASTCRSASDETFDREYFDGGQVALNDQVSSFELFDRPGCSPFAPPDAGPQHWKAAYAAADGCWQDAGCRPGLCPETLAGAGLDRDWGAGAPCAAVGADGWVAEFRAGVEFTAGEYVFYLEHDDGAQLWLDGFQIAHYDLPGSRVICSKGAGFALDSRHSLRLLLREQTGQARVRLVWDQDASACQPVPVSLDLATGLGRRTPLEVVVTKAGGTACACREVVETDDQGAVSGLDLTGCVEEGVLYDFYGKSSHGLRQALTGVQFQAGANALQTGAWVLGDTPAEGQPAGDNRVNLVDYRRIAEALGTADAGADVNGDGTVDGQDLAAVEAQWGRKGAGWLDASACQAGAAAEVSAPGAAPTPGISLSPASGSYQVGDRVEIESRLDTGGQALAGVDLAVDYDPGVLRVVDADPGAPGVQVRPGAAFGQVHHNEVGQAAGEILFSASAAGGAGFQGEGLVATLPFSVVAAIDSTEVRVRYGAGQTAESNAVASGPARDVLGGASGATLRLGGEPVRALPMLTLNPGSGTVLDARQVEIRAGVSELFGQVREVRFEVRQQAAAGTEERAEERAKARTTNGSGGGAWTVLGSDLDGADGWDLVWDASGVPDGLVDLRATALLPGGGGATVTETGILLDRTPPTLTVAKAGPAPAPYPGAEVTIEAAASDGAGSGIAGIDVYARRKGTPGAGGAWFSLGSLPGSGGQVTWDTAGLAAGAYEVAFDTRDRAGNQGPAPDQRLAVEIEGAWPYGLYLPLAAR